MKREEQKIFTEYLKRLGLRRTPQRYLILEVFLDTEAHVSSEALCKLVRGKDQKIGTATIYRALKLFKECGLAQELESHDGQMLYEPGYNRNHHDHLICTQCSALIEFYSEEIEALQDEIVRRYNFQPHYHSHRIFGLCTYCQKANGASTDLS